jgi:hypothetical protein
MKSQALRTKSLVVLLLAAAFFALPHIGDAQGASPRKAHTALSDASVTQRANGLLKRMTPEEKIGQLTQYFRLGPNQTMDKQIAAGQDGSVLFVNDPAETNRLQKLAVGEFRLHIPFDLRSRRDSRSQDHLPHNSMTPPAPSLKPKSALASSNIPTWT